jgi:hypothetical protein
VLYFSEEYSTEWKNLCGVCTDSPFCVGMQIEASSFDKTCRFKCCWHTLCDPLVGVGCKSPTLKFETNHISSCLGCKFCKIQCFKFKKFQQAVLWNGHSINRTDISYTGQIVVQGQRFKTCNMNCMKNSGEFFYQKGKLEFEDLFSQDENRNQIACVVDMFGLLNELNVCLQSHNS